MPIIQPPAIVQNVLAVPPAWYCAYFFNGVPVNVQRKGFANVSLKYSTNDSIRFRISSNEPERSMSRWTVDNCGATDFLAMRNEWGLGMKCYQ